MKNVFVLAAFLAVSTAALAAPAKPAPASKCDKNAGINISSDAFQADLNAKTGTYTGNVIVIQCDTRLRANTVRVSTADGKADKVLASGKVVVDSPASGTATGDNGVYSVGPRVVVMTGNVVLTKGKDVMRGQQLTVNMVTGQAVLGGGVHTGRAGQPGAGRFHSGLAMRACRNFHRSLNTNRHGSCQ